MFADFVVVNAMLDFRCVVLCVKNRAARCYVVEEMEYAVVSVTLAVRGTVEVKSIYIYRY